MSLFALAALLGTLLPLVIAVVQQQHWPNPVRAGVALALAVVASVGTVVGQGDWHGIDRATVDAVGTALAGMVVATWGSYHALWKQLGLVQWIERVTTFVAAHKSAAEKVLAELEALTPDEKARVTAALTQPPTA